MSIKSREKQKAAGGKIPRPSRYRHVNQNPFSGKNGSSRRTITQGFNSMAEVRSVPILALMQNVYLVADKKKRA